MNNYTGKDIKMFDTIGGIRERYGMYIGSADIEGVHQCIKEIVTNSIDEALNGYGKQVEIKISENDVIEIVDNGRGVPFDDMENGIPAVVNIFTNNHAGGKFGQGNYSVSGGLNGCGGTAVNALSDVFVVTSSRDGRRCQAVFKKGRLESIDYKDIDKKLRGTKISFKLDSSIFSTIAPDIERLHRETKELSYLTPGVALVVNGTKYFSKNGMQDMLKDIVSNPLTSSIHIHKEVDIYDIEIALQYEKSNKERIFAFTNNISNPDGGTHVTGFKSSLTTQMNKIAKEKKLIKENVDGDLWRRGLVAAISVKMKATPTFSSQIKTKLTSPDVRTKVSGVVTSELGNLIKLADLEKIVSKILVEQKAENAAQRAREAVNKVASGGKSMNAIKDLPSKLVDCSSKNGELFLCEGLSAMGSIVSGRDAKTQACLGLKGKVLNTIDKDLGVLLNNAEIKDMITSFGCGIGDKFNLRNLRYKSIIIATDADEDGKLRVCQ